MDTGRIIIINIVNSNILSAKFKHLYGYNRQNKVNGSIILCVAGKWTRTLLISVLSLDGRNYIIGTAGNLLESLVV